VTIKLLAAEMHVVELGYMAAWSYAQAAACPWHAVLRRWCLIRRARVYEREMEMWVSSLYAELELWRARHPEGGMP
jgi:hypothetical protein